MKIIYLLIVLSAFVSCTTTEKTTVGDNKNTVNDNRFITLFNKKQTETKSLSYSEDEKSFFEKNIIPESQDVFLKLYFSYLNSNYEDFCKNAEIFIKNNKKSPLNLWIVQKIFILIDTKFETVEYFQLYFDLIEDEFIKYIVFNYKNNLQTKQYIKTTEDFYNIGTWFVSGPYLYAEESNFKNFDVKTAEKINELFVENKSLNFQKGGLTVNEMNQISGIYYYETYFESKDDETINFYLTSSNPVVVQIDGKEIFHNKVNEFEQILHNSKSVKLQKGKHKINVVTLNLNNKETFLYTNKKLENYKNNVKFASVTEVKDNFENYLLNLSNEKYSNDLKYTILFEVLTDIFKNRDIAYYFLNKTEHKNFYVDYLYFRFYSGYSKIAQTVENEKKQFYLKSSLEKKTDFFRTKYLYTVNYLLQNPYEGINYLEELEKFKTEKPLLQEKLISLYLKTNQYLKAKNSFIDIVTNEKSGCYILFNQYRDSLKNLDIPLFQKCSNEIDKTIDLIDYKTYYTDEVKKYMTTYIKEHPYSLNSLTMLRFIANSDIELYKENEKFLSNNFELKFAGKYIENIKNLTELIAKYNNRAFNDASFVLNDFNTYFKIENDIEIIKSFEKENTFKKIYPITKILDEDVILIKDKHNYYSLNHLIVKVNDKEGINQYSTISRKKNYLKIATISKDNLTYYEPDFKSDTLEISLQNLNEGDYIVMTTYNITQTPYTTNTLDIGNFYYQAVNGNTFFAKLKIFVDKNIILSFNPLNGFNKENIKITTENNYTCYTYTQKNIDGLKPEYFMPQDALHYIPNIKVSSQISFKDVFLYLKSAYEYSMSKSYYVDINVDKLIKNIEKDFKITKEEDIKKVFDNIIKNYIHTHNPYSPVIQVLSAKQGNVVYLLKYIFDKLNINSEILIFNTKDNFVTNEVPNINYYTYYILQVNFNNKYYYLDPVNKHISFNSLSPYIVNQEYLRIDNSGNIIKEKFSNQEDIESKTLVDIYIDNNLKTTFNLKIVLPSHLSSSIKDFVSNQSFDKVKLVFNQFMVQLLGYIDNFDIKFNNIDNKEIPFEIEMKFSINNYIVKNEKDFIIKELLSKEFSNGFYNSGLFNNYTMIEQRETPLKTIFYNNKTIINLKTSKNNQFKQLENKELKSDFGYYSIKSEFVNNLLTITSHYKIDMKIIKPEKYNDLKSFSKSIQDLTNQEIIFN